MAEVIHLGAGWLMITTVGGRTFLFGACMQRDARAPDRYATWYHGASAPCAVAVVPPHEQDVRYVRRQLAVLAAEVDLSAETIDALDRIGDIVTGVSTWAVPSGIAATLDAARTVVESSRALAADIVSATIKLNDLATTLASIADSLREQQQVDAADQAAQLERGARYLVDALTEIRYLREASARLAWVSAGDYWMIAEARILQQHIDVTPLLSTKAASLRRERTKLKELMAERGLS